ncbi:phosphoglycerate mutase (plasmid) [Candidatus Megaera polyxenophila]|nr:phosphoglycerate mutase [Candidatus Megaera polyxenophila]
MKLILPRVPFYLVRHGQTYHNINGLTSGVNDCSLTKAGFAQAKVVRDLIHELAIVNPCIYSSPLRRAKKTSEIISNGIITIKIVKDLKEREFGDWEGKEWQKILQKLNAGIHPPNGETTIEHIERFRKIFRHILIQSATEMVTPIIVGHGGSFYCFSKIYKQKYYMYVDNCHLYYFEPKLNAIIGKVPWNIWYLASIQEKYDFIKMSRCEFYS